MKVRSAYTRLLVADLEACFRFYQDVLEFPVVMEDLERGYAEFAAGEMKLALFRRLEMAEILGTDHKPAETDSQDQVVLIFTVPNLDEVYEQLSQKGVPFDSKPINNPNYELKIAYIRDPDGTLIGLFQTMA